MAALPADTRVMLGRLGSTHDRKEYSIPMTERGTLVAVLSGSWVVQGRLGCTHDRKGYSGGCPVWLLSCAGKVGLYP